MAVMPSKPLHSLTNQLVIAPTSLYSGLVNFKNHCSCVLDILVAFKENFIQHAQPTSLTAD